MYIYTACGSYSQPLRITEDQGYQFRQLVVAETPPKRRRRQIRRCSLSPRPFSNADLLFPWTPRTHRLGDVSASQALLGMAFLQVLAWCW